jgi:hypothetical protein
LQGKDKHTTPHHARLWLWLWLHLKMAACPVLAPGSGFLTEERGARQQHKAPLSFSTVRYGDSNTVVILKTLTAIYFFSARAL